MKSFFVVAVCCTGVILMLSRPLAAAQNDWPTHRGNAHRTGNTDGQAGPKTPKVRWVYKSAEHYVASPVPYSELIYLSGLGAFNTGVFNALTVEQKASERVVWSKTAPYIKRPTVCAPAVVDGLAVFGDGMHQTNNAILYCVKATGGSPVWQYPVPGELVHIEGSPTVSKGRVYFGGGNAGVLCLDLKRVLMEGKEQDIDTALVTVEKRRAELKAAYERDRKSNPQFAIPPSEDELPKPVSQLLWQKGKGKWHVDAPLGVAGEGKFILVASSFLDAEKVGKRSLLCLKATDGSVVWEAKLEVNPWAGPTVTGNIVLVGCSSIRFDRKRIPRASGEVIAFDLLEGKVLWRHEAGGGVLSAIAVKDGLAVYTCTDGKVTARKCDTGKFVWAYDAKCSFFAGPALAADVAYAADLKTVVHAINLADGKVLWSFDLASDPAVQTGTSVFGSPIVSRGSLYLATCNLDGQTDQPSAVICLSD